MFHLVPKQSSLKVFLFAFRAVEGHDEESIQGLSISPDGMIMVSGDVAGT
jgi:hypothetical protein